MQEQIIHDENYYRSLTRNMVILIIVAAFTPLILINGIIGYKFNTSYKEKVIAHLKEMVEKHKQSIDSFLNEKLSDILVLSESYSYDKFSKNEFLARKLHILKQEYGQVFVDLGVVNEQGIQMAYAGPFRLARADYSKAKWFKEVLINKFYISDVFLGLRGLPHFIIAVLKEENGQKWILRATIDFVAFNNLVGNIRIGKTGLAYILNRQGEFQTKPRVTLSFDQEFYRTLVSHVRAENLVYFHHIKNEMGDETIYLLTPLKKGNWVLVFQQADADAFSDLYQTRNISLLLLAIGGCSIVFIAIFLSRKMVKQIRKADLEKEMTNEQVIEAGKLASLGELAAGIAHEINNPVAIMVEEAGWIEDLLEDEDFKQSENLEEFIRALKQIKTQGARCKEITHKLLSFARKIDSRVQSLQINDLIDEVVALSEKRARYNCVQIETRLTPALPKINASPSEMQQVLLNLINNSLDAIEPKKGGKISITSRREGDYVVIAVADTGKGIPKANLQRIFEPFFTTKPVGKGTGLGLSICYGIIKKMGGEITVNSAVGVGTTFHIKIPINK
ncbi:hypothetical protein KFV02_08585 [Desulfohalobiaceae bacterium Ax17]|uniref:sensor histidine kinase n=1 Tax=Desulfovulcanus ferrireducens TaxID=2831190 RepID=UPI00207BC7DA|nr:PAS domain-containing sensor histidine kinase [Desulfovulcanus ferrireducens]MBT8763984.1 hypothetical protein [Desulfovulcanus ferrireducens]